MKSQLSLWLVLILAALTKQTPINEISSSKTSSGLEGHSSISTTMAARITKESVTTDNAVTHREPVHPEDGTTFSGAPGKELATTSKNIEKKGKQKRVPKTGQILLPTLVDEGNIVVFQGICGSSGCAVEGDIYEPMSPKRRG